MSLPRPCMNVGRSVRALTSGGGHVDATPLWSHRRAFEAEAGSVCHARAFVGSHLMDHGQPELVDDVALVMSELGTNAVVHARTPFSVTIQAFDESLLLMVSDDSPAGLSPGTSGPLDMGGRGLMIVDALTSDWGVTASPGAAKSVWARFPAVVRR